MKFGRKKMNIRRKVIIVLSLFTLFLAARATVNAKERNITKTTLPNGLTVILEEDKSAPVVAFQMWVMVGSADEKDSEAGIAHVFEHMLFKGTKKRGVGQIAKEVEAAGGSINAFTSFDSTVYHLALASRYFGTGLDIISDAIQHSSFDPVELKKELGVVMEELRMNEDRPGRKLYNTTLSTAYSVHPYRRPVIGYEKTVNGVTREKVLSFFSKWYIPNNMTLVIAGDFDAKKALGEIKESFNGFKKKPNPHLKRPSEPTQSSLKIKVTAQPIQQSHMAIAFHIPALKDKDTYSLDAIASILGEGVTSRLYKRLKIDEELVHTVSAYAMTAKDPGLFLVTATLDADNTDKAVKAILEELKKLSYGGPAERELDKAKLSLESDFIYARETMEGKAEQLGYYQTISGDLSYEEKYIEGIRKVTGEKIQDTVKKYFSSGNMTVSVLTPEDASLKEETLVKAAEEAEKVPSPVPSHVENEGRDITKVKLENGITLLIKEDHSNPTVSLYATVPGGLRFETQATNGVGNFVSGMLSRGTKLRTRENLAREVEDIAGGINGFSGWNSAGVSAKFLSRFFDRGLNIFAEVVQGPSFPDEEIEKLRKDILAAIRREKDYLPGYTFKLLYRELYPNHPYGMPVIGTESTVSHFKREDLTDQYRRLFATERTIISIVGDINTDYVIENAKAAFKDFKQISEKTAPALSDQSPPPSVAATGEKQEKEQTNIGIGFIGPRVTDEDYYAMNVLTEVLSSQGGRLFIELRDKQSLAYAISAFLRPGVEPGIFAVYVGCEPSKKDKAIEGILKELKKTTEEKITDEELKRAKSSIIGSYELELQEVSSQASDMATNELLGLGYDHFRKYPEKINNVTAEDVLKAAQKYILLDNYVISVVGPGEGE